MKERKEERKKKNVWLVNLIYGARKKIKKMKAPPVRNNLLKMSKNNQLICATLSLIRRSEKLWIKI